MTPDLSRTDARRGLVIGWMPVSMRSQSLANRLGFGIRLLGRTGFRRPWTAPLAYPVQAARTIGAILRARPRALVVVAPPFVVPIVALPVARLVRARMAVDIHTGALVDRRWRWSVPLLAWACRRAGLAIVTLPSLAETLRARGVETAVLPDPLPDLVPRSDGGADGVVAVCSWAPDEPIDALIRAAIGRPWRLAITGRPGRVVETPDNVRLTGFLDDAAYVDLLAGAAVVVVLTTRDETLLSGAWEAIALGRPLVLSSTAALRSTFGEGPAYVEPTAESIAAGIESVLADHAAASAVTAQLRDRFLAENDLAVRRVASHLAPGSEPVSR